MDDVLHHERLRGGAKRLHRRNLDELPDGAFTAFDQTAFAIQGDTLLRWTPNGYHGRKPRPPRICSIQKKQSVGMNQPFSTPANLRLFNHPERRRA